MAHSSDTNFLERYGPWAIVTGASSGIGEGFARVLAENGMSLILTARSRAKLEALADELRSGAGVEVVVVEADLAVSDFIEGLMDAVEGKDIGLVVSNAGDGAKGPFAEQTLASKIGLLDLNCRAPLLLADRFVPRLIERGRGGFLITSSIESVVGFPLSASYAATKAFATSLGEGLWGELREAGVDVLVLEPGATDTAILKRSGMDGRDMIGLMQPGQVAREAIDRLASGPVFVAGGMNRFLTGLLRRLPRGFAVRMVGRGMADAIEKGKRRRESER